MIRRSLALTLLLSTFVASSCTKRPDDGTAGTATSDSLLASSPVEQPQGQIQPQTDFTPVPQQSAPPAPSSSSRPRATPRTPRGGSSSPSTPASAPGVMVAAGTGIPVTINTALTSETAQPGDSWSGTVAQSVIVGSAAPFPAGATVHGVVDGVKSAVKGDRALLVLRITSIDANGSSHSISATGDSVIAGSTRARNIGAVAGGAAAGALIGKAVGGGGKGALIGGLLGGAAATGAVAKSRGYQATIKEGAQITFIVDSDTRVRL